MPLPALTRVPLVVAMTPPTVVLPDARDGEGPGCCPADRSRGQGAGVGGDRGVAGADRDGPDQVLAPARLRRAPVPPTPVPTRLVTGSAIASPAPSISIAAPEATVVPVAVVPRAVAAWTRTIPALTVVAPV